MSKTIFVIAYLALGGVSLFFGKAENDLLAVGMSQALFNVVNTGVEVVVATVGAVAVAVLGLSLPPLPAAKAAVAADAAAIKEGEKS